jgi:3',5'-cyclic AMP phosphodiesterase CpdA
MIPFFKSFSRLSSGAFPGTFPGVLSGAALLSEQVRWGSSKIDHSIDQTRLAIADAPSNPAAFSFLVVGDTDAGAIVKTSNAKTSSAKTSSFSDVFANELSQALDESCFLLHTGDVTYPVGSYENYLSDFLQPYQALLSHLPTGPCGGPMVFNRPLLPVPGNHDYANWPANAQTWQSCLRFLCDRLRQLNIDLGHYGGEGGEAYGQIFLDDLAKLSPQQLTKHLATHYSATAAANDLESKHCLNYRPGQFTRLPNRYYRFRYGGVDFFALDSNTWNSSSEAEGFDQAQLDWLARSLISSWQQPSTIGRIIYLHHSPYTTEETRWQQPETLWVRRHLRSVLDKVALSLKRTMPQQAPFTPVDLIISGHAHCLEHLRTADTGHADAQTDWIVCGGSGADIRRQRRAGSDLLEKISYQGRCYPSVVAKSQLYAGIHSGRHPQRFHSFIRIDVRPTQRQKFTVQPFIVTQSLRDQWQTRALSPLSVGNTHLAHVAQVS